MMDDDGQSGPSPEQTSNSSRLCPIVGIGASAGGIQALRRFFPNVRANCGMAFVIVLHLDPGHTSELAGILARSSALPVTEITNDTPVEPNHVYVIPPNASLAIEGGHLFLTEPAVQRGLRRTIDEFFVSLARDRAEHAACVVLSGTGSDGTLGLRAVKEQGGITLAQTDAEYDGMMRSAVATGVVDYSLPVEELPAKLEEYFSRLAEGGRSSRSDPRPEATDGLAAVVSLLRTQTGHDFSGYKASTLTRRIWRRMNVLQVGEISEFVERLRKDPRETAFLLQDLLIGVTTFFRDPDAFAVLERRVIPELFRNKGADDTVRVWVPGCATGEEAYSIAILLRENAPKSGGTPKLQVFATDIDEAALETARMGRYPATVAKDIPEHHLAQYFFREDGTYRTAGDLREMCLFSAHNLLIDPPFSRLDLISCRNLLIYFNADLQNRVIPLFHYALNPDGYLFLGTSENVGGHSRLFAPIDRTQRIFRRRAPLERRVPQFPLTAPNASRSISQRMPRHDAVVETSVRATAERQVLELFSPAYVVVNSEGELLQASARTGKYLELPSGAPDTNIFSMARAGLRLDLRAALHRASSTAEPATRSNIVLGVNGGRQELDIRVQPLRFETPPETLYLIVFQDRRAVEPSPATQEITPADAEGGIIHQLETELRVTKERLQTATEELEASNEELKSGNEELQSTNEELQSTNEELQTSKEELQSINEELQTVNSELNARVEELSRANNDMSNLLESTQIATIFLDRALAVKSFTPAAKDVFWLVESDAGRPIMHVRARFDCPTLHEDAERVLRTLVRLERPVSSNDGNMRYIMRMLPYRTTDNVINGVVLTFSDVTRISEAEAKIAKLTADLRTRISELETLLEIVPVGVMICENGSGALINNYGARLLGQTEIPHGLTVPGKFRLFEGDTELAPDDQPLERARRSGQTVPGWQGRLENSTGRSFHVMISATPLFGDDATVRGAIAAIVDITPHKQAEEHQQLLLDELQHRVKNLLATVSSLATRMSRTARTVDEFHSAFIARMGAMGRVHDLLVGNAWKGASLQSLVAAAVEPFMNTGGGNVRMTGPEVTLSANSATSMGMILNELATNAAKYGSLSVVEGRVDVVWGLRGPDGETVQLAWTERNGPAVRADNVPGFGSGLIARSVEYELQGSATLAFEPAGLKCTIEFPLVGNNRPETKEG